MIIKYKILETNLKDHSIIVRYYTDKITEESLANEFDSDGNITRRKDGSPTRCRTDYNINIWKTPSPPVEEIEKHILSYAPKDWFKLQESIIDPEIDTSLSSINSLIGNERSLDIPDEIEIPKEEDKYLTDEEIEELLEQLSSSKE